MGTKASSSWSSTISFIEESLLLPTEDVRCFARIFLLIFTHTFVFIAVAVHFAHPLATSILHDFQALRTTSTASYNYSEIIGNTREHTKKLFFVYLAYHASRLTTQLITARATSMTYSAGRCTGKVVKKAIKGFIVTGAFVGVLELISTGIIILLLVSSWTYADQGIASICSYLLLLLTLLLYIYLGTVLAVSVAVAAVDENCHSVWAIHQAWRLMGARRKEAAALVLIVSLLPAAVYPAPVYAFSFAYHPYGLNVWLLGAVSGSGLPSVGAQLFSMVAATVFCCQSKETKDGGAHSTE